MARQKVVMHLHVVNVCELRLDLAADQAMQVLYERANLRGLDDELWRHSFGCRQWLLLRRDRVSHAILSVVAYAP